jgi:hypothetical protein
MADLKISQLTAASTPLAGTEVLPIVQSGSTVKVSVANLTAGRAVAMAGGSFTDNITQSTAAKGVNFTANTPAAGMTSQLLNWYEEGTWTPTISGTWTNVGTPTLTGTYTRIGRQVTVVLKVAPATSISATTAASTISGVPFGPLASGVAGGTQVDDNAQGYVCPAMAPNGLIYVQTTGVLSVALYISVTYFV